MAASSSDIVSEVVNERNPKRKQNQMVDDSESEPEFEGSEDGSESESDGSESDSDENPSRKQLYKKFLMELAAKDVGFPVAAAMELVPASKRPNMEKKWEKIGVSVLETCKKRSKVILETLDSIKPPHSH